MLELTLGEKTYMPEDTEEKKEFTTSLTTLFCDSIISLEMTGTKTNNVTTYPDELSEYSIEAQKSILRGLSQTETHSLGSFAQYID